MSETTLTAGQCATLACLLEVSAPKPGNVHRAADFEGLTFYDMAAAAVAIGPAMDRAVNAPLGRTVFDAVAATRKWIETNANLGTVLLVAPMAATPLHIPLQEGVKQVLSGLTKDDALLVYEAIRLARPGAMGQSSEHDVRNTPPDDLLVAMRVAAEHDLVARQYGNGFADLFDFVLPRLTEAISTPGWTLPIAIVHTQLQILAAYPDSLIARKCGVEMAERVSLMAAQLLELGTPDDSAFQKALADFDFFLRSDHHRRNPGTTADLVAAGLFVALRDGQLEPPLPLRPLELAASSDERQQHE